MDSKDQSDLINFDPNIDNDTNFNTSFNVKKVKMTARTRPFSPSGSTQDITESGPTTTREI